MFTYLSVSEQALTTAPCDTGPECALISSFRFRWPGTGSGPPDFKFRVVSIILVPFVKSVVYTLEENYSRCNVVTKKSPLGFSKVPGNATGELNW